MLITILLSIMMMAGLFLLLWGGVGFIQDKRFMSSAPKEALAVVPDRLPERFKGQYALGYVMVTVAFALMGGAVVLGAWHGIVNDYSFLQFFIRFMIMLLALKAYDVIFFDWVLLCNQGFGFFTHYYRRSGMSITGAFSAITRKIISSMSYVSSLPVHCSHGYVL